MAVFAIAATGAAAHTAVAVKGIVVGSQRGVLLVAAPTGAVSAVQGRAAVGARISATGGKVVTLGRAHRAVIRGVLVRQRGSLSFISAAQHLLVVRTTRHVASARDTTQPQPGSVVQTTVGIDDQGELDEQSQSELGQTGQVQVQAVIASVAAGSVTVTVNGQSLTIPLPAGLTLPASLVGSQVSLNLSFANGQVSASDGQGDSGDDEDDDDGAQVGASGATGVFDTGQSGASGFAGTEQSGRTGGHGD